MPSQDECGVPFFLMQVSLLYRTETQHIMPASSGTSKYNLQVADILPSIGIIHDMVTGKPS